MKWHPKTYEDPFLNSPRGVARDIDSMIGDIDELAARFRDVIEKSDRQFFHSVVNFVWLELQFVVCGKRRRARSRNSIYEDRTFSHFIRNDVGLGQKTLTGNQSFTVVSSYLKDFFPDFLEHDPRVEPEYFVFPYHNISLEHLYFVYKVHNRIEMLEYAEERAMKYLDFANWAVNQAFCYNDEVGRDVYSLTKSSFHFAHLTRKVEPGWHKSNLDFHDRKEA